MSRPVYVAIDFGTTRTAFGYTFDADVNDFKVYLWKQFKRTKVPTCVLYEMEAQPNPNNTTGQSQDRNTSNPQASSTRNVFRDGSSGVQLDNTIALSKPRRILVKSPKNNNAKIPQASTVQSAQQATSAPHLQYKAVAICDEAQQKYTENPQNRILVDRFKMALLSTKKEVTELGVIFPLERIITDFFLMLKNIIVDTIVSTGSSGANYEYKWSLSVPAMWTEQHKLFLKECAVKAGMIASMDVTEDEFQFVFEPECALVAAVQELKKINSVDVHGKAIMVVDMGGGTVDLVCHKVDKNESKFVEITEGEANSLGSTTINSELEQFFCTQIGLQNASAYAEKYQTKFLTIKNEINSLKENCRQGKLNFSIPIHPTLPKLLGQSNSLIVKDEDSYVFQFPNKVVLPAITKTMDQTLKNIQNQWNEAQKKNIVIDFIVLVGGFSMSCFVDSYLKPRIEREFPTARIVHPSDAETAVLKGALYLCVDRKIVSSRVTRCIYGIETMELYDKSKHPVERVVKHPQNNLEYCTRIFKILCQKGSSNAKETKKFQVNLYSPQQKAVKLNFCSYVGEGAAPMFIDEDPDHTSKIGEIIIRIPQQFNYSSAISVEVTFGGTMPQVKAVSNWNRQQQILPTVLLPSRGQNVDLPFHFVLVIDISKSMENDDITPNDATLRYHNNNRLGSVLEACRSLIRRRMEASARAQLEKDRMSLIFFNETAEIKCEYYYLDEELFLEEGICDFSPKGNTNFENAFEAIYGLLVQSNTNNAQGYNHSVVFLSDGEDTHDPIPIILQMMNQYPRSLQVNCVYCSTDESQSSKQLKQIKQIAICGNGSFAKVSALNDLINEFEAIAAVCNPY